MLPNSRVFHRPNSPSKPLQQVAIDAMLIAGGLVVFFLFIREMDIHILFKAIDAYLDAYSGSLFDQLILVSLLSIVGLFVFGLRRLLDQRREIEARQRAESRAQHLALADALTGLPNRRRFEEQFTKALIEIGSTENQHLAVMMIDLDRFKPVNDVFGHAVGDQVLISFAQRAIDAAGPEAFLARFGGDEFALLLKVSHADDEPARVARRLLALFDEPFDVLDVQVTLGASIGVAIAPEDGATPEELMRRADIALYRAKSIGRGNFRFFEVEMDAALQRRAQIERDLRKAIGDGSIQPSYQPIIALGTGEIIGFEALARWDHPDYGQLPPEQFIAIAEDGGLIIPLSSHLLRLAARDAQQWPAHLKLCFNISRVQLSDPMLVLRVLMILGETGLSPKRLEVEITEEALVSDTIGARAALDAFHAAGIRIALDDFGSGNSSLQHLRTCHFDRLKIDRTFVGWMAKSEEDASLVNAILGLSRALGISVTAEGIEDRKAFEMLLHGGCTEGQGFRYSEAVSQADALLMIGQAANVSRQGR